MNKLLVSVIISVAVILACVRVERATNHSTGVIISNRSIRKLATIGLVVLDAILVAATVWALVIR